MDVFLGQLLLVPYNFAPRGWALCNGAILSIQQNTALFALLGTMYGGDGRTTFALPNLQGSVALGSGNLSGGGSSYAMGQTGGSATVSLLSSQLPSHTHTHRASTSPQNVSAAASANFGLGPPRQGGIYGAAPTAGNAVQMNSGSLQPVGGGLPHENMQPYLTLNWIIALQGIFPQRP